MKFTTLTSITLLAVFVAAIPSHSTSDALTKRNVQEDKNQVLVTRQNDNQDQKNRDQKNQDQKNRDQKNQDQRNQDQRNQDQKNQDRKNQDQNKQGNIDLTILNFALTLEFLEADFYNQALIRFNEDAFQKAGFNAGIRDQISLISFHESTHVTFLQDTIAAAFGKNAAVPKCDFNFDAALKDIQTMLFTAGALEVTGTGAYVGAIADVNNNVVKTAAAAIATIEGRHSAALNIINKQFGIPNAFETPLGINSVLTLASPFISSCSFKLPGTPNPPLLTDAAGKINQVIILKFKATIGRDDKLQCNFQSGLSQFRTSVVLANNNQDANCIIPEQLLGSFQAAVFVVNKDKDVGLKDDGHVVAGPTFLTIQN